MTEQNIQNITYMDALRLAHQTPIDHNYAGWIIYQDANVKYVLDTLEEGRSFRISKWLSGQLGSIIHTIHAPSEILFLYTLLLNDYSRDE